MRPWYIELYAADHSAAVSSEAVFMTTDDAHHIAARSSCLHGALCPSRALHCWKALISSGQCLTAICTSVPMTFGAASVAQSSKALVSRSQLDPAVWQACSFSACALQNAIVVSSCAQTVVVSGSEEPARSSSRRRAMHWLIAQHESDHRTQHAPGRPLE